ncbi:MAG: thioredoxin family protein [Promethearchaeota archaeon]
MANKTKVEVLIIEEENFCAKCCKTMNVIDKMMETIPGLKDKVEVFYSDLNSQENLQKYGELTPPIIMINDVIFSEGHVPIIKKLARRLLEIEI